MPSFTTPGATIAGPCGISIALPSWVLGISIPGSFPFPPKFPPFSLNFHFKLSCDPTQPVTIINGVPWGGGRVPNAPPDPDLTEWFSTF
jgi:hypothetical protein